MMSHPCLEYIQLLTILFGMKSTLFDLASETLGDLILASFHLPYCIHPFSPLPTSELWPSIVPSTLHLIPTHLETRLLCVFIYVFVVSSQELFFFLQKNFSSKPSPKGQRDGSTVRSPHAFCNGSGFNFQHPLSSSHLSLSLNLQEWELHTRCTYMLTDMYSYTVEINE